VGSDGTITSLPLIPPFTEIAIVGRVKLVNPDVATLNRGADGLFRTVDRQPLQSDAAVQIRSGALESSNVNAVDGLIATIKNARAFDLNMQLIQRLSSDAESATRILNIA